MNIKNRLSQWLWEPTYRIKFVHPFLQIGVRLFDKFFEDNLKERAQSLAYTTLLSIVPLLAVSFSVLKSFNVHHYLIPYLEQAFNFLGDEDIGDTVITMVENVQVTVLGGMGLVVLFYTVVNLITTIESAFNRIWGISKGRTFWRRVTNYLVVVLIGPVLAFSVLSLLSSSWILSLFGEVSIPWLNFAISRGSTLVVLTTGITLTYLFLPNKKVYLVPALVGGFVASSCWYILGQIFTTFVVASGKYSGIYSGFASVMLFVLWMYASWLIILLGNQITYFVQHPESLARDKDYEVASKVTLTLSLEAKDTKNNEWVVSKIDTIVDKAIGKNER